MEFLNDFIIDEIRFTFKFKGEVYTVYTYAVDIEETDAYSCEITKHNGNPFKDVSKFYFDSCGGTIEELGELELYVMNILFNNDSKPIIRGF